MTVFWIIVSAIVAAIFIWLLIADDERVAGVLGSMGLGGEAKIGNEPAAAPVAAVAQAEAAQTTPPPGAESTMSEEAATGAAVEEVEEIVSEEFAEAVERMAAPAEVVADAIAEDVNESSTPAAKPTDGSVRDDFTKIKGIGKVYQQRLYDEGIYTWEQFLAADAAKLEEITNAIQAANVEEWHAQARKFAGLA